jgi:hypothetical protein
MFSVEVMMDLITSYSRGRALRMWLRRMAWGRLALVPSGALISRSLLLWALARPISVETLSLSLSKAQLEDLLSYGEGVGDRLPFVNRCQ